MTPCHTMNNEKSIKKEVSRWIPHESRNTDKAHNRRLFIQRQLSAGAKIKEVRTKILRLHRQSTVYNGNGSYTDLKEALGLGPDPIEEDDSEEAMTKRVDDLLDEIAKSYERIQRYS